MAEKMVTHENIPKIVSLVKHIALVLHTDGGKQAEGIRE